MTDTEKQIRKSLGFWLACREKFGWYKFTSKDDFTAATVEEIKLWRELVSTTDRLTRLSKAVERVTEPEGHAPCRSGGLGPEGVCANTCSCEWVEALRKELTDGH